MKTIVPFTILSVRGELEWELAAHAARFANHREPPGTTSFKFQNNE
jgi:hypothetical protein